MMVATRNSAGWRNGNSGEFHNMRQQALLPREDTFSSLVAS